jgi:hypothetical protein
MNDATLRGANERQIGTVRIFIGSIFFRWFCVCRSAA